MAAGFVESHRERRPSSWLVDRLDFAERILRQTPVVNLPDERVDLFAKLEYLNGIGSVKDRPAYWILRQAIVRGQLKPGMTIVESSSGNFAHALAVFAKLLELNFVAVVDPNISPLVESLLLGHSVRVVKVSTPDDSGGFLKTRLATVQELMTSVPDAFWPNQYGNPDAMQAHYRLTAAEILASSSDLDYVFVGVSSGGTIAGLSQRLKEHHRNLRIVAVDVEGSAIFGAAPADRYISGLGSSIRPPLLDHALIDDVVLVSEAESIGGCHELLEHHGLFVGASTGGTYAAIHRYFGDSPSLARPRVLFLCCDSGSAYLHNVFDARWTDWRRGLDANARSLGSGER